jgi:hypothetical protein
MAGEGRALRLRRCSRSQKEKGRKQGLLVVVGASGLEDGGGALTEKMMEHGGQSRVTVSVAGLTWERCRHCLRRRQRDCNSC